MPDSLNTNLFVPPKGSRISVTMTYDVMQKEVAPFQNLAKAHIAHIAEYLTTDQRFWEVESYGPQRSVNVATVEAIVLSPAEFRDAIATAYERGLRGR